MFRILIIDLLMQRSNWYEKDIGVYPKFSMHDLLNCAKKSIPITWGTYAYLQIHAYILHRVSANFTVLLLHRTVHAHIYEGHFWNWFCILWSQDRVIVFVAYTFSYMCSTQLFWHYFDPHVQTEEDIHFLWNFMVGVSLSWWRTFSYFPYQWDILVNLS